MRRATRQGVAAAENNGRRPVAYRPPSKNPPGDAPQRLSAACLLLTRGPIQLSFRLRLVSVRGKRGSVDASLERK